MHFSPREAYVPMKISCEFGEPSWCSFPLESVNVENLSTRGGGVANAKPKNPLDASRGYNYLHLLPYYLLFPLNFGENSKHI